MTDQQNQNNPNGPASMRPSLAHQIDQKYQLNE